MVKHLKIFDKINIPEEYYDKIEISKVIIEEAKYLDDEDERDCAIHLLQIFKAQMQQFETAENMDENERASIELGMVIFYLMTTRMEKIEDNSKKETNNLPLRTNYSLVPDSAPVTKRPDIEPNKKKKKKK